MPDDKRDKESKHQKENPLLGEPRPRATLSTPFRTIGFGQLEVDTTTGEATFRILGRGRPLTARARALDRASGYGRIIQDRKTGRYSILLKRTVSNLREAHVEGIGPVEITSKDILHNRVRYMHKGR